MYKWLNITVDHFYDDNMTVNFTIYGDIDEILIGTLYFIINAEFDISRIFLTDVNKTEMLNTEASMPFTYV